MKRWQARLHIQRCTIPLPCPRQMSCFSSSRMKHMLIGIAVSQSHSYFAVRGIPFDRQSSDIYLVSYTGRYTLSAKLFISYQAFQRYPGKTYWEKKSCMVEEFGFPCKSFHSTVRIPLLLFCLKMTLPLQILSKYWNSHVINRS